MEVASVQSQTTGQMVTARMGGEVYGIPIEAVEGIISWEPLTRLPRTPAFLSGLLSVRGSILPVMDLRVRLGLEASAPTHTHRILILQVGGLRFGTIVDSVRSVEQLPHARVERKVPLATAVSEEFLDGIVNLEKDIVILLKPDGLFTQNEFKRLDGLMQKASKITDGTAAQAAA